MLGTDAQQRLKDLAGWYAPAPLSLAEVHSSPVQPSAREGVESGRVEWRTLDWLVFFSADDR